MFKLFGCFCLSIFLSGNFLYCEVKILAFSGSTRKGSFNALLLENAAKVARDKGASVTVIDLNDLPMPFYNADLESERGMPEPAKRFRRLLLDHDVIMIASPEYNGSIPAILKNAIDWGSRSEDGKPSIEAFKGKKIAIMSASPGEGGGVRGLTHLRAILENLRAIVVSEQVSVPNAQDAFTAEGRLKNPNIQNRLNSEIELLISK